MGTLHKLPDAKTDVRETLEEALKMADDLSCVVVLGLTKDRAQILRTSTCAAADKAFLLCFFQAWMSKWFKLGDV